MYDICIIGSGPAGLTLCNELSKSGKKICLIESGSKDLDERNKDLKKVISVGEIKIKDNSRERAWGGTSNTWTGLSAPLDKIDFERWPIGYSDLEKYYQQLEVYGFGKLEDFYNAQPSLFKKLEEKKFTLINSPLNFGERLQNISDLKNVDVLLGSTVTKIHEEQGHVVSVRAVNTKGLEKDIKARQFIVCAGGLESARLLLASHLGGANVGKYLMNHPKNTFGILKLNKPIKNISYMGLRLREDSQKQLGVLNSYIRLEPVLSKSFLGRIFNKLGLVPTTQIKIRNFMEMEPSAESAMTLSSELDRYGNPLPIVNLNTTELDRKSLIELHEVFAEEVEKNNLGKFVSGLENASPWPITSDASHHLGGTIMGTDREKSVVDTNLKVHSLDNLYICSGSVFPTSGCANPTYTICALALRLANHLLSH